MKLRSIIVGRADDCDIVIKDEYASPRHCEIFKDGRGWLVRDLGSTNGTRVCRPGGDVKINWFDCLLRQGDVIVVGRTALPRWDVTQ
jgi:pSer/pThr/pTyr-binding forkhead associated (FHA) protein